MDGINFVLQRVFNCQTERESHLIRVLSQPNTDGQWERETRVYFGRHGVLTDRLVRLFEQEAHIRHEPLVRAIFETTSVRSRHVHRLVLAAAQYDLGNVLDIVKASRNLMDAPNTHGQTPLAVAILNASGEPEWAVAVAALLEAGAEMQLVPRSLRGFRAPTGPEGAAIRERLSQFGIRRGRPPAAGNAAAAPGDSLRTQMEAFLQHPQPQLPHEGVLVGDIPQLSYGESAQITVRLPSGIEVQYWIYAP